MARKIQKYKNESNKINILSKNKHQKNKNFIKK
jgi:hypothetical protein